MTNRPHTSLTTAPTRTVAVAGDRRRGLAARGGLAFTLALALAAASCTQGDANDSGTAGTTMRGTAQGGAGGGAPAAGGHGGSAQPSATGGAAGADSGTAGAGGQPSSNGGAGVAGAGGGIAATGGTAGAGAQPSGGSSGGTPTATGGQAGSGPVVGSGGAAPGTGVGGAPAMGGSAGAGGAPASGGGAGGGAGSGGSPGGPIVLGSGGTRPSGSGGTGGTIAAVPGMVSTTNSAGSSTTVRVDGALTDDTFAFYQPLGSNGRSCGSCHLPDQAMSLTPAGALAIFNATDGNDPLFRPVDGAVSPLADVSTVDARRTAYAMLLSKALIRVGLPIPANADFDLVAVNDPYGYASAAELSLFRRPLPAANLRFLSTVMWDGREGTATGTDAATLLRLALLTQADDATLGHAQGGTVGAPNLSEIADFELGIYTAQASSTTAGPLDALQAFGGPLPLVQQNFFAGINDPALSGMSFDPNVFSTYAAWAATTDVGADADARRQIARGEQLFNTRTFTVTGVAGLNTPDQPSVTATCSFCHDAPGAGSSSSPRFFDIGLTTGAKITADLPSYTLRERSTGTQVIVSDPGRALITGAFKDVSTFKVPTLRGLAGRAPYFHNGSAGSLSGVVAFYNAKFAIGLTTDERAALTAFLASL